VLRARHRRVHHGQRGHGGLLAEHLPAVIAASRRSAALPRRRRRAPRADARVPLRRLERHDADPEVPRAPENLTLVVADGTAGRFSRSSPAGQTVFATDMSRAANGIVEDRLPRIGKLVAARAIIFALIPDLGHMIASASRATNRSGQRRFVRYMRHFSSHSNCSTHSNCSMKLTALASDFP
jgi:hypothetical protein